MSPRSRALLGLLLLAVVVIGAGAVVALLFPHHHELTVTAGHSLGRRHAVALALAREAEGFGLTLRLEPCEGSIEALDRVQSGRVDVALVQGGLAAGPDVREVGALYTEPLHLLARPELAPLGLTALAGRRVNLGPEGSGTRELAGLVIDFASVDRVAPTDLDYAQLESLAGDQLPDAVFMVQSMPSEVARFLVRTHGYRLVELPFARSMAFRDVRLREAAIPAMMYSVEPPVPAEPLRTLGTSLLVVAHRRVPASAVDRLLRAIWEGQLARTAHLPELGRRPREQPPELALHEGAIRFARRREPLLRADLIESLENARSFLVSVAIALVLLWRWLVRRRSARFDRFMDEVTAIERRAMELELAGGAPLSELLTLRNRLSSLKAEALELFTYGKLRGEELMSAFLQHVADVRAYLSAQIDHAIHRAAP